MYQWQREWWKPSKVKLWHLILKAPPSEDRRREVNHEAESQWTDEAFVEYLLPLC